MQAIAGCDAPTSELLGLRYQLFSATAGAWPPPGDAEAGHAVVFVHERDDGDNGIEAAANDEALRAFLQTTFEAEPTGKRWCIGPYSVSVARTESRNSIESLVRQDSRRVMIGFRSPRAGQAGTGGGNEPEIFQDGAGE